METRHWGRIYEVPSLSEQENVGFTKTRKGAGLGEDVDTYCIWIVGRTCGP